MRNFWIAILALAVAVPTVHAETKKQDEDEETIIIDRQVIEIPEIRINVEQLRRDVRRSVSEIRHHIRDTEFQVHRSLNEAFEGLDRVRLEEHIGDAQILIHRSLDGVLDGLDRGALRQWQLDWTMAKAGQAGDATDIDQSKTTSSAPEVYIRNITGSVKVNAWEKNEIRVQGTLGEDVERLQFDVNDGDVNIRVVVPENTRNAKIRSELTIFVPEGSRLDIHTVTAGIEVSDVQGPRHELQTVSGSIKVNGCAGDFDLQTVNGSIKHEDARGDVNAETINGSITIGGLPEDVDAEAINGSIRITEVQKSVRAEAINGSIRVEGNDLEKASFESISGSIRFEGSMSENGKFDAESLNGSVELKLSNTAGRYELETRSGGIHNDFGPEPAKRGRRGRELQFTHGERGGRYVIQTFNGSIKIEKK